MAIWRRKPRPGLLNHSDQCAQFTSREWASFLREHNLDHSMSRRGNCHDNAVAESFFQLLKREEVRRRKYRTRDEARRDVFEYIELFYNLKRKHTNNGMLSPVDYENRQRKLEKTGVYETRGTSDTDICRVLASMSEAERANTIVMFIGDTGTPSQMLNSLCGRP